MASRPRSARIQAKTRANTPPFRFKSALQERRDGVASRLNKRWLPHGLTRGIANPSQYCYMNSALQAFMHQPIFLNWIRTHNRPIQKQGNEVHLRPCNHNPPPYPFAPAPPAGTAAPVPTCTSCALKFLVNRYWANITTTTVVPFPGPQMNRILDIAIASGHFRRNAHDDSCMFFDLMLERLQVANVSRKWDEEYRAILSLNTIDFKRCTNCGTEERSAQTEGPGMILDVTNTTASFDQALNGFFQESRAGLRCSYCRININQIVTTRIEAGPQVLKIKLAIFRNDPMTNPVTNTVTWQKYKVMHTLQHPNTLDLTAHKLHNSLPLRYTLSSVISHSGSGTPIGSGHYIASVRGPGDNIRCISDPATENFTPAQMSGSPQRPVRVSRTPKQVYILTYLKDDVTLTRAQRKALSLESEMI